MNPESFLGICGRTGLDGHGGLDRIREGDALLITGGEEAISGGVKPGVNLLSGEVFADSIE